MKFKVGDIIEPISEEYGYYTGRVVSVSDGRYALDWSDIGNQGTDTIDYIETGYRSAKTAIAKRKFQEDLEDLLKD